MKRILVSLWILGFSWLVSVRAAEFNVSVEPTSIEFGDHAVLSLNFENVDPGNAPRLPTFPNAEWRYIGPSQQIEFINGRQSSRISYRYQLTPKVAGAVTIPALSIKTGNQTLTSEPVTLTVTPAGATPAPETKDQQAFVRLIAPTNSVYYGESFPVEVKLYFLSIEDAAPPRLNLDGFILGKTSKPEQTRTRINGQTYGVVTWKMAVTAAKLGELSLGPAELEAVVRSASSRNSFFGDFFAEKKRISLATPKQTLRVIPVPTENRPSSFNGAVGQFKLNAQLTPTDLAAGDPASLRIQIAGTGNLDQLELPLLDTGARFRTYEPRSDVQTSDALGLEGVKSFEQVVIPEESGNQAFPPIEFSFFNPKTRNFETLKHPATTLRVRPAPTSSTPNSSLASAKIASSNSAPAHPENSTNPSSTITLISTLDRPGVQSTWLTKPWLIVALLLPPLTILGWSTWRRTVERRRNDPYRLRHDTIQQLCQKAKDDLVSARQTGEPKPFLDALHRYLREHLAAITGASSGESLKSLVENRILPAGISQPDVQRLNQLVERLENARYAPVIELRTSEFAALTSEAEQIIRTLQDLPKTSRKFTRGIPDSMASRVQA